VKKLMTKGVDSDIDGNDYGDNNDHEMCEDYEEGVNEEDANAQYAESTAKDFEEMFRIWNWKNDGSMRFQTTPSSTAFPQAS